MLTGTYKFIGAKTGNNVKGDYAFINVAVDSGDVIKLFSKEVELCKRVKKIKPFSDVTITMSLGEFRGYPSVQLIDIAEGGK